LSTPPQVAANQKNALTWLLLLFGGVILGPCSTPFMAQTRQRDHQQLAVFLKRAPDTAQDTVTLTATAKNVSTHDVLIGVEGLLLDYSLALTDSRGVPVSLSPYGKKFFSKDRILSTMAVIVTLHAGETRVDTWAIDNFFAFVHPGQYRITVRRNFEAAHESDSSNTLDLSLK